MLSSSNVEAVILEMNSHQEHNNYIELLNDWTQLPESIFTALDLVCESKYENVQIVCSTFLSHSIVYFWNKIDADQQKNFREQISNYALNYENKDQIIKYISKSIAKIAIFDWPDEWPEFSLIILPSNDQTEIFYYNSLEILSKFVKAIQTSPDITESRRSLLINFFVEQITEIIDYLARFIDDPLFAKPTLKIFSYLLLWIPNDEAVLPPIFEKIFDEFLMNEETCSVSLKCLTSIFISRSDSSVAFRYYAPYLIQSLSNSSFPNQQPISSNNSVIEFAIKFLNLYMVDFQIIFVYDRVKVEPRLSPLVDPSVDELYETIITKKISLDDLKGDLIHLFQVILSLEVEDIKECYWQLWFSILKQMKCEIMCNFNVNPANEFFQPFLTDILKCLYDSLPSAVNEDGIFVYQARGCFNSFFFIDQDTVLQFINDQQPSVNLCYLIGMLEFVLNSNEVIKSLSHIVLELLETLDQSSDPFYTNALLFCLPHSSIFFHENNELFSKFIDFVITCIDDENAAIRDSASNALAYVVNNRVGLFSGESKEFTESIVDQSEKIFFQLNKTSSFSMFRTCTQLICQNDQVSNAENLFQRLFEPVLTFLNDYLNQIKEIIESNRNLIEFQSTEIELNQNVEYSVSIINECTNANYFAATHFFNLVWPILSELTKIVIENPEFSSDLVSVCLETVAWIQVNLNPEEIDEIEIMQQIFQAMLVRGSVDESIFDYISIIKEHDEDDSEKIDDLYPFIHQNFIEPVMNFDEEDQEDIPLRAILKMMAQFNVNSVDIQWIISLAIEGIRDYRKEVNLNAIQCLRHIISSISNEQFDEFTANYEQLVITALIESITDNVHKNVVVKLIDFLKVLISVNSFDQNQKVVKPAIMSALNQCAVEPNDGFFENFADYILSIHRMYVQFKEAFLDLLIVLKKATPGDSKLFEVEPVHQNIVYDEFERTTPTADL